MTTLPIRLISTDFDGTIFAEFEDPPISRDFQKLIGEMQAGGAKWAINTGRDLSSLLEALARAQILIEPDYLILVEREIYAHNGVRYVAIEEWNHACARAHEALFARIRDDLPRLIDWINGRFHATVYEDAYSPFCLIASTGADAEVIYGYLDEYCRGVPDLALVRNDVYARFSHVAYNKGTALAELTRRLGLGPEHVFAAGDHWNDLPMLSRRHARWLAAPQNAIDVVKSTIRSENGYLSRSPHGHGVAEALEFHLRQAGYRK